MNPVQSALVKSCFVCAWVHSSHSILHHPLSIGTGKDRRDLQRGNGRHNHRGERGDGERRQIPRGAIHTQRWQRHTTGGQPACHRTLPLR